ncbi:MAG: hypothetical protein RLZZ16_417 [Actinomycetota bacterium]|jgi:hypothetical protein|nr:hypothetical protein [Gammaproteobacteria bacterium]
MFRPELRSPVARAVAPILGGILFFAALFGVTWLMADLATDRAEVSVQPGDRTFVVGNVEDIAEAVKTDGPILYPDLRDATGKRSIVIEHNGEDPAKGWQVYYAYPADRDESCLVTQIARTHTFTDCEGRTLAVEELMAPLDVRPIVENKTTLLIDLRGN